MCVDVLSSGLPEAPGLHSPPHSLQRGLQTWSITLLALPSHQQKALLFLKNTPRYQNVTVLPAHVYSGSWGRGIP